MAPHRLDYGDSSRLTTQPVNPQRTPSSRLPARSNALPLPSGIPPPPPSSSKLVKKKPAAPSKSNGESQTFTRSPSVNGVRRVTGEELRREMALPRVLPTSAHITDSQKMQKAKLKTQPSSRVPRFDPIRTPSLVSGSSAASTADSPKSRSLNRKASNISNKNIQTSPEIMSSHDDAASSDPLSTTYNDPYPDAVLGISLPPSSSAYYRPGTEKIINLDRYVEDSQSPVDLPPPGHFYNSSSTPSTGYSPGPFSISSTPTSMSSISPGILVSSSSKHGPRTTQPSPTRSRPPVVRQGSDEKRLDPHGLAPVRESSSSSASTIRGSNGFQDGKTRLTLMPSPPPGPPKSMKQHVRKKSDTTSTSKNELLAPERSQRPPELAHLMDSPPRKGYVTSPPVRPSRDGTPEINLHDLTSPIIQSNMNSLPVMKHKRQSSSESRRAATTGLMINTKTHFGLPRVINPSPSPSQSSVFSPLNSRPPTRGTTPEIPTEAVKPSKVKSSPVVDGKSASRFGFFTRRNKSEAGATTLAKDAKTRKGPSAGTGHERYGKFAFRGRSGSTTSGSGSTSAGRSPSTDSMTATAQHPSRKSSIGSNSGSDVDDFLAERLNPITLRGNGSSNNVLERAQSADSQSSSIGNAIATRMQSSAATKTKNANLDQISLRPVLLPSPMADPVASMAPIKRSPTGGKKADKGEEKSNRFGLSSLSSRRASRRSFLGGKELGESTESVAQPVQSPSMGSVGRQYTAPTKHNGSMLSPEVLAGKEGVWSPPNPPSRANTQPKVALKQPKKWGFFQRAKSPVRKSSAAQEKGGAVISRQIAPRAVAHYAMVNAPPAIDATELEKIMQEAESMPGPPSPRVVESGLRRLKSQTIRHGNSVLLPEPPTFLSGFAGPARPASPKVTLNSRIESPEPAITEALPPPQQDSLPRPPRPSRLAQVGRIPRVVSKRDRERNLPEASFSRPFVPTKPSPALKNGAFTQELSISSPELVKASEHSPMVDAVDQESSSGSERQNGFNGSGEFFTFPPRKDSQLSATSSSSGIANLTATVAILPRAEAIPMEDEIWNEYDDLLDLLSTKTPKTPKTPLTGSSLGAPFQYSGFDVEDQIVSSSASFSKTSPILVEQLPPSVAAFAQRIRLPSMHDSRLFSPNPSTGTPTSGFRMSDFLTSYGERNLSFIDPTSGRLSLPPNARSSTSTVRRSLPLSVRPTSTNSASPMASSTVKQPYLPAPVTNRRDSRAIENAEREHMGFESMATLRLDALMTSKWLSFDRVLFSPAHSELKNPEEDRVLVLDGLGKDWSYYVALTYSNATIYNLGTDPADIPSPQTPVNAMEAVTNHRHIHHPSLNSPFPFPKGFFAAVVFRFPVVSNESAYRNALFECKRVLRPGGYLEVSVLDMDMLNMGSRTRSALRSLKMQMQVDEPNISLKPLSDTIQRLLGRRGFENINRCMVGVPAAGRIQGSRDESMNSAEPSSATESSASSNLDGQRYDETNSPAAVGDKAITKKVARIGRWWYSRCYENGGVDKSIWADDALIRECEKRGTSLRLMVCYAQKPDCPVRRTISV
ncbi:hypothetical protein EJ08DRAFT_697695 [Tothia fuscella]|uniref:Methyltransferase type 11 domain-containing protein n=1 Tax=Tothia fuscella TaxID=1048955 RepID=A0A9P4NRJ7_9PEZI|nr:hypothetical protein EJ08DRAFT_697695 [Tothia fuscella]